MPPNSSIFLTRLLAVETHHDERATLFMTLVTSEICEFKSAIEMAFDDYLLSAWTLSDTLCTPIKISQREVELEKEKSINFLWCQRIKA